MKHKKSFYIAVTIGMLIIIVEAAVLLKTLLPGKKLSGDRVEGEQEWDWSAMAEGAEEQLSKKPIIGDTEPEVSDGEPEPETPDEEALAEDEEVSSFTQEELENYLFNEILTEEQQNNWYEAANFMGESFDGVCEKYKSIHWIERPLGDYNTGNYETYVSDELPEGVLSEKFVISPTYGLGLYDYMIVGDMATIEETIEGLLDAFGDNTDAYEGNVDPDAYTYVWHYGKLDLTIWAHLTTYGTPELSVSFFNSDFMQYGEYMLAQ